MPCMLLYGDSGVGKTMLFEKTECQHPNPHHERHGHDGVHAPLTAMNDADVDGHDHAQVYFHSHGQVYGHAR